MKNVIDLDNIKCTELILMYLKKESCNIIENEKGEQAIPIPLDVYKSIIELLSIEDCLLYKIISIIGKFNDKLANIIWNIFKCISFILGFLPIIAYINIELSKVNSITFNLFLLFYASYIIFHGYLLLEKYKTGLDNITITSIVNILNSTIQLIGFGIFYYVVVTGLWKLCNYIIIYNKNIFYILLLPFIIKFVITFLLNVIKNTKF